MKRLVSLCLILASLGCGEPLERDLPEPYRSLEVPVERLRTEEARARGAAIFQQNCELCHGVRGDGKGLRSSNLTAPPRDLTSAAWAKTTTPRRLYFTIQEGLAGTPMPAWKALSGSETWDLVAYVMSLSKQPPLHDESRTETRRP